MQSSIDPNRVSVEWIGRDCGLIHVASAGSCSTSYMFTVERQLRGLPHVHVVCNTFLLSLDC